MIQELDTFHDFFQNFKEHYTLIRGVACHLSMEEAGIDFTKGLHEKYRFPTSFKGQTPVLND